MTHGTTWHVYTAGEPIACPARKHDGSICGRAQDRVGPDTSYRVRVREHGDRVAVGSLERVCRGCNARLEVQPCPTTTIRQPVTR